MIDFISKLQKENISFIKDEPMNKHTSFKIGGNAQVFVIPNDYDQLRQSLAFAKETKTPVFILGNGSNILVSDNGINGAVISTEKLSAIITEDRKITAFAGAKLSALCIAAKDNSLTGLEFAYGIPGTVGGAVYMNAGAYGGEMKDVIQSVTYLSGNGELITANADELDLSYRHSRFCDKDDVIISAEFSLERGDKTQIDALMKDILQRRVDKQPLNYPSAGSTFKRPEGYFAGALIESSGLKGVSVGGAMVSEKHAGFVINTGDATANDIFELVDHIKKKVLEDHGVSLECEIKFIGEK